jgi:hypothetical protein
MEGLMNGFRAGFGGFGLSQLSFITKVVVPSIKEEPT